MYHLKENHLNAVTCGVTGIARKLTGGSTRTCWFTRPGQKASIVCFKYFIVPPYSAILTLRKSKVLHELE